MFIVDRQAALATKTSKSIGPDVVFGSPAHMTTCRRVSRLVSARSDGEIWSASGVAGQRGFSTCQATDSPGRCGSGPSRATLSTHLLLRDSERGEMEAAMASRVDTMSEHGQSAKPTLPSCNLCRKRKIKCDRVDPCANCQRSSMKCVFSAPSRLPRGRQGGRRKADSELLSRIAKLESLVKNLEGDGSSPASKSDSPGSSDLGMSQQRKLPATSSTTSRKTSKDDTRTPFDKPFLRTISDEISGLRYVISSGQSDDEDDELDSDPEDQGADDTSLSEHSRFAICGPGWLADQVGVSQYPSAVQISALLEAYMSNVHTVLKILHGPSLRAYLQGKSKSLDCSPGPKGLEALHFSIFHAAATSLTEEECLAKLGEERQILLRRYRLATELGLAKAEFINATEMSTLQALVLFLQSVRAYDRSRFSWTLVSLCVRIAQALGLQRENNHCSFPLFQREMRRRLWWQICMLDMSLAGDRGTDPFVGPGTYNTQIPLYINDADIWLGGPEEVPESDNYADMAFSCIVWDIYETSKQLNYVPAVEATGDAAAAKTQAERIDLVMKAQERLEQRYLRHLDMRIPIHWGTKMVADCIRGSLWLQVYRPLQQRTGFGLEVQHPNVLHLSLEIMERGKMMLSHPATASFTWLSASYVQWHPLAITLAELCVQTEGPLVERAWASVEQNYEFVANNIADGKSGTLFRPIKKLYQKAQKVRQNYLAEVGYAAKLNPGFSQMDIASIELPSTTSAPLDFNIAPSGNVDINVPDEWLKSPEIIQGNFNWDPFFGSLSQQNLGVEANDIDIWQNFIVDFQGSETALGQNYGGMYNFDVSK